MDLEALINEIDIVEYISQFVDLEEKNGEYWGLSPFSHEKTPSFSVRRETKSFYCFSSGIGGNVFTFVRYYHKCSKREAVEILERYAEGNGIEGKSNGRLSSIKIYERYTQKKKNEKSSQGKVFDDDCMEKYTRREDKLSVWEREGISRESLDRFQVRYDDISDRIVYPIRDIGGRIVNIGGRTLDPEWKEKRLRKYTYFSGWGRMNVIYGLHENLGEIISKHEIILYEGCKSVLIADSWGIRNTGAILTSHLNPYQMQILAALGVDVVFALDKEIDVTKDRNINRLKKFVNVEYLVDKGNLLDDKDSPVDKGEEVFWSLYKEKERL